MLKNYFKIALRYFWRHRTYAFINVFGLSIALAVCILLFLFEQDELNFDSFHLHSDRIYQVYNQRLSPSYPNQVSHKLAPQLAQKVKDIQSLVRTFELGRFIKIGAKKHQVALQAFDANFAEIFNFKFLKGNSKTALQANNSIVLSEKAAREYFGTINILNQKILMESELSLAWDTLQITGIIENCPANSSIYYDIIVPFEKFALEIEQKQAINNFSYPWLYNASTTFALLNQKADNQLVAKKIDEIYKENIAADSLLYFQTEGERYDPSHRAIHLLPLRAVHLNAEQLRNETAIIRKKSSWKYAYIFGFIAFLILLVACFNFTNLSLVHYVSRAREIGLRKVLGATRRHLIYQFYSEAFLLAVLAGGLAIILSYLALPIFNSLISKDLAINGLSNFSIWLWLLGVVVLSTILAGFYPALVFSGFQPIEVLKGMSKMAGQNRFSTWLVILQFATAVLFITLMLVMNSQLYFLKEKSFTVGREINQVIEFYSKNSNQLLNPSHLKIKAAVNKIRGVKKACLMFTNARGRLIEGKINQITLKNTLFNCIEKDYLSTLQLKIVAGKNFDNLLNINELKYPVLVNETFVQKYQLKYPLGQVVELTNLPEYKFTIIGVVQDYVQDLYKKNQAEILIYNNPEKPIDKYPFNQFYNLSVRVEPAKDSAVFAQIEQVFAHYNQVETGVSQIYLTTYIQESLAPNLILPKIITYSATLPILIALMGLIGTVSFQINQRTKEIGIRKTLGASTRAIMFLLAFQFQKLVLLGILIALPVVGISIYYWLKIFAFAISPLLVVALIILSCIVVVVLSLITVLLLVYRKAQANPIESLRYE
jgi:putative ABC transport system permease protein